MADRNVSLDIEALPKHFTVLINAGTSKKIYAYNVLDSVHRDVIFLALSHPAHNMIRTLDRLGVGTDKLEFIDAITKRIDSKTSVDGCEYLYSRDYNEVLKAIERKVQSKGIQDNVLFVDALHHLLLQDDSKTAMNFCKKIQLDVIIHSRRDTNFARAMQQAIANCLRHPAALTNSCKECILL